MNNAENTMQGKENLIYDAVKDLTKDALEYTVRKNAAAKHFILNDEHMGVINALVEHYKQACATHDCLAAHEQMRFLEEAYAAKGGGKYLYQLFDAMPDANGVLMPIHDLAGLPAVRLGTDKGFGTAF